MTFTPDYRHFLEVMNNRRPSRLPIYEHILFTEIMELIMDVRFASLYGGDASDLKEYFRHFCGFFKKMTYDVVSFEVCIVVVLPGEGAIMGGKPGPIQSRSDFDSYPWDDIPRRFWKYATPNLDAFTQSLPPGMKGVGGVGNGVFEIAEDLVGLEYLPFVQVDDPDLYSDLFRKIGDVMLALWPEFLRRYKDSFVACRFGDDLGFKSSLLTNPVTVHDHIIPQYKRVIDLCHDAGLPFLYHSCGCIFQVMDDIIDLGIDAKHSNEDCIAPFDRWIDDYGDRIGLLGGFDMDFLCRKSEDEVYTAVFEQGKRFRNSAKGYALGSGKLNSTLCPSRELSIHGSGCTRH